MEEIKKNTPYGDTGCMDTESKSLIACVDWVGVTFFDFQNEQNLFDVLQLKKEHFTYLEKGWKGYLYSAVYGNIIIAWGTPEGAPFMGYHVEMSGQGCRQYEQEFDLNLNWSEFFALCLNFSHKFTRLDVAIDDYVGYFTMNQLYKRFRSGCVVVPRVRKFRNFETGDLSTGQIISRTLYVGKGDWMFRFYDKKGQCIDKGIELPEEITHWNRSEIQLRNQYATSAAKVIAFEDYSIGEFVKGVLTAKMDVKIKSQSDTNRSRWKTVGWWEKFIGDVEAVTFTQQAPEPSIVRIKDWLERQVDTSLATLLTAFDGNTAIIRYFLYKGQEKISAKQEYMIDEFQKNDLLRETLEKEVNEYLAERYHTGKRVGNKTEEQRWLDSIDREAQLEEDVLEEIAQLEKRLNELRSFAVVGEEKAGEIEEKGAI